MGGRHTLAFSETSQDAPQIKAGIWSRSCLTKARQRDKSVIGPEIHLTAHTALGDQPGNLSICDSTVPRSHSPSPCRLTTTESCCQIAQHQKTSHQLCGSPQSTQSHKLTTESGHWLFNQLSQSKSLLSKWQGPHTARRTRNLCGELAEDSLAEAESASWGGPQRI